MTRVRISTTVDAQRWAAARRLLGGSNSQVVDRALAALIEQLEAEQERTALAAFPYEDDADLAWEAPPGDPDLPYDGEVPADVLRLAEQRRWQRREQ
jgi:hypothetical protein